MGGGGEAVRGYKSTYPKPESKQQKKHTTTRDSRFLLIVFFFGASHSFAQNNIKGRNIRKTKDLIQETAPDFRFCFFGVFWVVLLHLIRKKSSLPQARKLLYANKKIGLSTNHGGQPDFLEPNQPILLQQLLGTN
ncbi:hypothetical protein AKJ16_DCAP14234 [Drosera capensis]